MGHPCLLPCMKISRCGADALASSVSGTTRVTVRGSPGTHGVVLHHAEHREESVLWSERALSALRAKDAAPDQLTGALLNVGAEGFWSETETDKPPA